jgi:AmmeMemoRadiSam system protein B/AmmeMemoRadiSam system protein A
MALMLMAGMGGCAKEEPTVFGPVVAGQFYTNDPQALAAQIGDYLDAAEPKKLEGEILGFVVPHAGYIYSGPVAAFAYDLLQERKIELVVVIAPSHYVRSDHVSVLDVDRYKTPLGEIPVARDKIAKLIAEDEGLFVKDPAFFQHEHSLEVQLPFLQKTAGDFKLLPLVMGNPSRQIAARLARALSRALDENDVIYLASSDMSHHFPYDTAVKMDRLALNKISGMDISGLLGDIGRDKSQLCGLGPVLTLMELASMKGSCHATLLKYANSGDTAGPKDAVVGYCTVSFTPTQTIGTKEEAELVSLARAAIEAWMDKKTLPDYEPANVPLRTHGAAFVTLKERGRLRGCIGHVVASMPLYRSVQEMAVAAAFEDPRFQPVKREELPGLTIEISVMSPLRSVTDPSEIQIGRDGLVIRQGVKSGLLLPQVASEPGWGRDEFLGHACMKANLPADAWKKGAEIYAFSAHVFGEGKSH